MARGETIYRELCTQCHGPDGLGTPAGPGETLAPALAGSPRVLGHGEYMIKTLLHGLTGPIDGRSYPGGLMVPMGGNDDDWIAAVATYVRANLSNSAYPVSSQEVARVRAAHASRKTPWTYPELIASVPRPLPSLTALKVSASAESGTAGRALHVPGWSSGSPQVAGMWLQVDLPAPALLTELRFESPGRFVPRPAGAPPVTAATRPPPQQTYPRGYRVQLSMDGTTWSAPVAEGRGESQNTVIQFGPARARFVRITLTEAAEGAAWWGVQTLRLYERASLDRR
jgi:cytochrome c5